MRLTVLAAVLALGACRNEPREFVNYNKEQFDTPTHRCISAENVATGAVINGAPVVEFRCTAYYARNTPPLGSPEASEER